jgi:hypothetical protein
MQVRALDPEEWKALRAFRLEALTAAPPFSAGIFPV